MKRISTTIVLVLILGSAAFTQVPSPRPVSAEPIATRVDKLFEQWDKPDRPGCALAVIKDGQIVYKRGYGMASLELAVPITTTSVFNVGSMAKQFTAMSILMLARQGKLSVDDDVRKYAPEVPDFGTPITLRHLIHHTSGLRDFLEMMQMAGWRDGDMLTEKDILDMVSRQRTLNHRPGEEYVYTNTGYVLLAVIVKRVTGQSIGEFAAANIFKPLGMTKTHFHNDHSLIISDLVDGYLSTSAGFRKGMPADDFVGSGSLFTTVEDLARWDENFYDKKVGGADLIAQMLTPGVLKNDSNFDYAYGLINSQYKGLKVIHHSGSRLGYRAQLMRFPEQHFSVACLCNVRTDADTLARRVADLYLADQFKQVNAGQGSPIVAPADAVKLSEKELSNLAGLFWNPVNDTVRRIYIKDGKLIYSRAPGNESELVPLANNRFLMLGVRNRVELIFKSLREGVPSQLLFVEAGRAPSVLEHVKSASNKPQQLGEFAGKYYSRELNTTYSIIPREGELLLRTGNWGDFLLSPRFVDSFANPEEMGSIMFMRGRTGRVAGFVIRSGKVRNLVFSKTK